jgi:acetyl-CoA carboxylase biotin carboxyl carrier protein
MTDSAEVPGGSTDWPSALGIRALADLCPRAGVEEIEAASSTWSVKLKLDLSRAVGEPSPSAETAQEAADETHVLFSQWVGVFHRAAESGATFYVEEGQHVEEGDIVGVVAAMQLQHEVPAHRSGVLRRFLVPDRTAVEYGQPMLEIT